MGLVDYGSDDSDMEEERSSAVKASQAPPPIGTKRAFQKVVEKSNPHKIKVALPTFSDHAAAVGDDNAGGAVEPDPKRVKLGGGGGGLRGINAFLPAPKRPAVSAKTGQTGLGTGRKLGAGISLKTGAEPAFSREPVETPMSASTSEMEITSDSSQIQPARSTETGTEGAAGEFKPRGKATRFMPLSISRRPKPKSHAKPSQTDAPDPKTLSAARANASPSSGLPPSGNQGESTKPKPKVSLFSIGYVTEEAEQPSGNESGDYQPLLYDAMPTEASSVPAGQQTSANLSDEQTGASAPTAGSQSLEAIASDLHLSAAERRQLFGRAGRKNPGHNQAEAINVVNFNTDAEYAANEEARLSGEQPEQQHRVVRTVNAAGRNSLRSLINAVSNQGDALEEHFAKGRRGKQEAGSKYGW